MNFSPVQLSPLAFLLFPLNKYAAVFIRN